MMNRVLRIGIVALALAGAGCVSFGPSMHGGGHGPSSGGHAPPRGSAPGYGGRGDGHRDVVRCESRDNRRHYCAADTRGGMHLVRQLSSTRCIQGSTWGYDARGVWVVSGCRGEFTRATGQRPAGPGGPWQSQRPGHRPGQGHDAGQIVRCESQGNRQRRCNARVDRDVQLVRQLSRTRCVQRQNWGWDRNGVWVRGGCAAEFRVR